MSAAALEEVQRALAAQGARLDRLDVGEVPALRAELASLRRAVESLEQRVPGGGRVRRLSVASAADDPSFVRSALTLHRAAADLPVADRRGGGASSCAPYSYGLPGRGGVEGSAVENESKDADSFLSLSAVEEESSSSTEAEEGESLTVLQLEANVWDFALSSILFPWESKPIGTFYVFVAQFLLILNIVMQGCFVVIMHSMAEMGGYGMDAMVSQRIIEGHALSNLDKKTMTTRIQQICQQDWDNTLAGMLGNIQDYLKFSEFSQGTMDLHVPGQVVCFFTILVWNLSIISEVRRVIEDMLWAVLALPTGRLIMEERDDLLIVSGVSRHRKVLCVLVLLVRFFIAVALLVLGTKFMVGTMQITNLLLNAAALGFIGTIKELLFEALVPRKLMGFCKQVKIEIKNDWLCEPGQADSEDGTPLGGRGGWGVRIMRFGRKHSDGLGVMLRALQIFGMVFWFCAWPLQKQLVDTRDVYDTLCGNNLNFVFREHPVTGMPLFASTEPGDKAEREVWSSLRCFDAASYEMVRIRAGFAPQFMVHRNVTLETLLNGSNALCHHKRQKGTCPERSLGHLQSMEDFDWGGTVSSELVCRDMNVEFAVLRDICLNEQFLQESPELGFFREVSTCADFTEQCDATRSYTLSPWWHKKINRLCPRSCGRCTQDVSDAPIGGQLGAMGSPVSQR